MVDNLIPQSEITKAEIARVEKALAETKSEYLKRDYNKYLKKLYKRLRVEVSG